MTNSNFSTKNSNFSALASLQVALANDCAQKTFKTGIVCVCNITYCDEIPDINLLSGQAATFTTSKSGARLHRDVVYATNSDPCKQLFFLKIFTVISKTTVTSMHLTIDSSKTYQTIQGFGSTFSDASGANLKSLPDQMADTILRQYFSDSGKLFDRKFKSLQLSLLNQHSRTNLKKVIAIVQWSAFAPSKFFANFQFLVTLFNGKLRSWCKLENSRS